jgi:hypothetical protein
MTGWLQGLRELLLFSEDFFSNGTIHRRGQTAFDVKTSDSSRPEIGEKARILPEELPDAESAFASGALREKTVLRICREDDGRLRNI